MVDQSPQRRLGHRSRPTRGHRPRRKEVQEVCLLSRQNRTRRPRRSYLPPVPPLAPLLDPLQDPLLVPPLVPGSRGCRGIWKPRGNSGSSHCIASGESGPSYGYSHCAAALAASSSRVAAGSISVAHRFNGRYELTMKLVAQRRKLARWRGVGLRIFEDEARGGMKVRDLIDALELEACMGSWLGPVHEDEKKGGRARAPSRVKERQGRESSRSEVVDGEKISSAFWNQLNLLDLDWFWDRGKVHIILECQIFAIYDRLNHFEDRYKHLYYEVGPYWFGLLRYTSPKHEMIPSTKLTRETLVTVSLILKYSSCASADVPYANTRIAPVLELVNIKPISPYRLTKKPYPPNISSADTIAQPKLRCYLLIHLFAASLLLQSFVLLGLLRHRFRNFNFALTFNLCFLHGIDIGICHTPGPGYWRKRPRVG
ncbi:hypothetical protein LXL04_003545 [Taraxacum kok-saghyz]